MTITAHTHFLKFNGTPTQALNIIEDLAHLEKFLGELSPELEAFGSCLNEAYSQYEQGDTNLQHPEFVRNQLAEDMGEAGLRVLANGIVRNNIEMDIVD